MRTIIRLFVLAVFVCGFMFTGCSSLETTLGSIAGSVFYSDEATRVGGGWIRVLDSTQTTIISEVPVDEQARFFISLPKVSIL